MLEAIKGSLKPFMPRSMHRVWRRARFAIEQRQAAGKPLEDVFGEIYEKRTWAREADVPFHSGPGSMPQVTAGYEAFVAGLIEDDRSIKRLVDVGCGDFQVASRILSRLQRPVDYIGIDVAANLVAYNQRTHSKEGVEFRHLDVSTAAPPAGDIVTVREVFQHLSNATILAALANLRTTFDRAIITEVVPNSPSAPNLDIVSGYRTRDGLNSGVFLELPPFNLTIVERYEQAVSASEILRTLVVLL